MMDWSEFSPAKAIVPMLWIHILAIVLTLLMPGFVAKLGHVFYEEETIERLPAAAKQKHGEFLKKQDRLRSRVDQLERQIDRLLAASVIDARIPSLIETKRKVSDELRSLVPVVRPIPFYLNPQMLVWPAVYTCLGWLVFVFRPPRSKSFRAALGDRRTWWPIALAYVIYQWPLWFRNFLMTDEKRVIYAYPNDDVHLASLIVQEFVIFGFFILLGVLWRQWMDFYDRRHRRLEHVSRLNKTSKDIAGRVLSRSMQGRVSSTFMHWIVASVILGLGFLPFTSFYWHVVSGINDSRYTLPAIVAHMLWGITWVILSLPLIETWQLWNRDRMDAISAMVTEDIEPAQEMAATLRLLSEAKPIAPGSVIAANVAAILSLLAPFLQLLG